MTAAYEENMDFEEDEEIPSGAEENDGKRAAESSPERSNPTMTVKRPKPNQNHPFLHTMVTEHQETAANYRNKLGKLKLEKKKWFFKNQNW